MPKKLFHKVFVSKRSKHPFYVKTLLIVTYKHQFSDKTIIILCYNWLKQQQRATCCMSKIEIITRLYKLKLIIITDQFKVSSSWQHFEHNHNQNCTMQFYSILKLLFIASVIANIRVKLFSNIKDTFLSSAFFKVVLDWIWS